MIDSDYEGPDGELVIITATGEELLRWKSEQTPIIGSPVWATNDSAIVFSSFEFRRTVGSLSILRLLHRDTLEMNVLLPSDACGEMPSLSPLGEWLLWLGYFPYEQERPEWGLWLTSLKMGEVVRLPQTDTIWQAWWAPDGRRVVYFENGSGIGVLDLATGEVSRPYPYETVSDLTLPPNFSIAQ